MTAWRGGCFSNAISFASNDYFPNGSIIVALYLFTSALFIITTCRIEASAPPPQIHDYDLNDSPSSFKEIESSSDQYNSHEYYSDTREKRSFFRSTITSYVFSGSTVPKSVTLGILGCNACISCVPSGINVC
jgi:hypothetical protein